MADFDYESVGQRVRSLRTGFKLSPAEVAASSAITQSTISDIERAASFSADILISLSDALQTTPRFLMTGTDEELVLTTDDGVFGAAAVRLLGERLSVARTRPPKALLASMRVPSRDLKEPAAFLAMLEELAEKYPESGRARVVSDPTSLALAYSGRLTKAAQMLRMRLALALAPAVILVAQASVARAQGDPDAIPFKKGVGELSQHGNAQRFRANGVIVMDGCHVATNFHAAFGLSKSPHGKIELVPDEEIAVGHQVDFAFDLDEMSGRFRQLVKAEVVAFRAYDDESIEGLLGDRALRKIVGCPAGGFAPVPTFDMTLSETALPTGKLMTISTRRTLEGKNEFVVEKGCKAAGESPVTGLVFMDCQARDGASGSLVLEQTGNSWRYAAMMTMKTKATDGTRMAIGLHSTLVAEMFPQGKFSGTERRRP